MVIDKGNELQTANTAMSILFDESEAVLDHIWIRNATGEWRDVFKSPELDGQQILRDYPAAVKAIGREQLPVG